MTREEILNTPEIVDFMIDKSVMIDSKMKLHNRLNELCKLAIKALEQEPKTGHWTKSKIGGAKVCSVCKAHMGLSNFNFCPNCGAKMVELKESEDKE